MNDNNSFKENNNNVVNNKFIFCRDNRFFIKNKEKEKNFENQLIKKQCRNLQLYCRFLLLRILNH